MIKTVIAALALACAVTPADAEVVSKTDDAFSLNYEQRVEAAPDAILTAVGRPAAWWSDAHTYSGSASNISIDLRPGGCWCEALSGGGVKHGEVLLVWPEQRQIRFAAPFGPLQSMGAAAILTMSWAEAGEGNARLLKWTFVVHAPEAGAVAEVVDGVMAEQFGRLVAHLNARSVS